MKFRFAALSISSMPMSTRMALRRVSAPARPMAKSRADSRRYAESGVMAGQSTKLQTRTRTRALGFGFWSFFGVWCSVFGVSFLGFIPHGDDDRANHCRG